MIRMTLRSYTTLTDVAKRRQVRDEEPMTPSSNV